MVTQGIYQFGDTAMLMAAVNGHTEIVRLLLQHGAEVNQHNTVTTHVKLRPPHAPWLKFLPPVCTSER